MAKQITFDEWIDEGERRFGPDRDDWKFVCARCGHVQSANEVRKQMPTIEFGKPENWLRGTLAMNCEGRLRPEVGCDWTLGGLFRIHKLEVVADGEATPVFEFADMA